ncbi:serum paraoxonase/arylesterase [Rhodocollybia butyracea]|uniref:Serum paraoxonase/arylesterase n=1 Tax=Rhodocollybia butyracea TaxID=206335 RepID=A0A9P5PWF1_9AGAR|nr:serum paraoxonase/arylesterase [Rhodocollybia butyracea]
MFGWTVLISIIAIVVPVVHQVFLAPIIRAAGLSYTVQNYGLNAEKCEKFEELKGCEKIVLHQATGVLYLACSTPENRLKWFPPAGSYETPVGEDYIATFDPRTSKITRLKLENFQLNGTVHGLDVVPSEKNPNELFVYLVNHRTRQDGLDPATVGADSVIQIFKTVVGGSTLSHITTFQDSAIIGPNDVTGFSDGKRFYFTNFVNKKTGFAHQLRAMFTTFSSVGYCHSDHGCKIVVPELFGANGITKASNGTIYVATTNGMELKMYEKQEDASLISLESIRYTTPIDNLVLDKEGALWSAGFPKYMEIYNHIKDSSQPSSVCAWKLTMNTGEGSFYGERYKVQKVLENNGTIGSGSTTVVRDTERGLLFMHGLVAPYLTVCRDVEL